MTEFIILSRVDMLTLCNDKPVTVYIDKKPYVLCTDEYFTIWKKTGEQEPCEEWYDVPSDEMTLEQARQAVKDLRKKLVGHLDQEPCEDAISRQAAQAKIKSICDEYRLSYEDGERKPATGGSAYALGHAFDDLPPVTQQETYANIPFLLHKESGCPLDECVKAYEKANEYLRSKSKLKGEAGGH